MRSYAKEAPYHMIEFTDNGQREVVSRNALRRLNATDHVGGPLIHSSLTDAKAASRASDGSSSVGDSQ